MTKNSHSFWQMPTKQIALEDLILTRHSPTFNSLLSAYLPMAIFRPSPTRCMMQIPIMHWQILEDDLQSDVLLRFNEKPRFDKVCISIFVLSVVLQSGVALGEG